MKIAIVGSGIAGNTIAHLLHPYHDITLFEKNNRVGGHSHTHKIMHENKEIQVDTGFIVFNKKTYPLFTSLLDELGVDYENSNMSFSVFSNKNNSPRLSAFSLPNASNSSRRGASGAVIK